MKKLSRREFLGKSALGAGTVLFASGFRLSRNAEAPSPRIKLPIGFQSWTIREPLVKDFPGTLKMMATLGYETIEMCSPAGYANSGFGPLVSLKASEMKKIINDAGLTCISSHYVMNELRTNLDERIQFALESGQTQMILSSFGLRSTATLDDWRKAAEELNVMGMKVKKAGLQMGFHNHHTEFQQLDGKLIYEELMKAFDPQYIKMQFQVAVISAGYKASDYFAKYPGRFISAHFADWSSETKREAPLGQGIVDWKELVRALDTGGVQNIYVEMGQDTFRESAEFLRNLTV